jgi:hypothetical protein
MVTLIFLLSVIFSASFLCETSSTPPHPGPSTISGGPTPSPSFRPSAEPSEEYSLYYVVQISGDMVLSGISNQDVGNTSLGVTSAFATAFLSVDEYLEPSDVEITNSTSVGKNISLPFSLDSVVMVNWRVSKEVSEDSTANETFVAFESAFDAAIANNGFSAAFAAGIAQGPGGGGEVSVFVVYATISAAYVVVAVNPAPTGRPTMSGQLGAIENESSEGFALYWAFALLCALVAVICLAVLCCTCFYWRRKVKEASLENWYYNSQSISFHGFNIQGTEFVYQLSEEGSLNAYYRLELGLVSVSEDPQTHFLINHVVVRKLTEEQLLHLREYYNRLVEENEYFKKMLASIIENDDEDGGMVEGNAATDVDIDTIEFAMGNDSRKHCHSYLRRMPQGLPPLHRTSLELEARVSAGCLEGGIGGAAPVSSYERMSPVTLPSLCNSESYLPASFDIDLCDSEEEEEKDMDEFPDDSTYDISPTGMHSSVVSLDISEMSSADDFSPDQVTNRSTNFRIITKRIRSKSDHNMSPLSDVFSMGGSSIASGE